MGPDHRFEILKNEGVRMAWTLPLKPPFPIIFHPFSLPRKQNWSYFLLEPEGTLPLCLATDVLSPLPCERPSKHWQFCWVFLSTFSSSYHPNPAPLPPAPGLASSLPSIFPAPQCPQKNPCPLLPSNPPPTRPYHQSPWLTLSLEDQPASHFP